ncbi:MULTISPECIES: DMT family transporter [Vibrio]|uniref:Multidrug DMT transporter permease n=2 Tax=Vibrio TaxID=662 RepID=A0A2N7GL47_9VIBR|nr:MULTISPECIES: DMT family transporter [Vibrio]MBY7732743.1 DMT family transporter [Vibrio splendidus]KAA8671104.1 DMT family transporter [Vibrio gigantis]MCC4838809.1 DMT family transporter [Vibrio lentus]MDH5927295.1 DMT family transporter [Vibrio lentus]PMI15625.1 multidrug DMT transporter permease [Vibrio lentus]
MTHRTLTALLFSSVCLIWGTTWLAMEIAVESIPPIFATGLRFLIAAPILVMLAKHLKQPLFFPKGQQYWMLVVAVFYFAIPFTLMIFGEQYISSGLASIIFANMPIAVMVMSRLFLGLRLTNIQLAGLFTAVLSLILILSTEMSLGGQDYLLGFGALGGAVAIHAVMYVLVEKFCKGVPVLTYNAVPSLIASICLLLVSLVVEQPDITGYSREAIGAVVYLGLFASVGGIVAYFKLGQVSSPFTASICFLFFPLIALTLSTWFAGNSISMVSVLLMIPLLGGILVTKADPKLWKRVRKLKHAL